MKTLVTHKVLQLLISKVNMETLGKFDLLSIAQYHCRCALLIVSVLRICTNIKSLENNQELQSNDEEDGLELGDTSPQEIPED